jgi:hypothetical protein
MYAEKKYVIYTEKICTLEKYVRCKNISAYDTN